MSIQEAFEKVATLLPGAEKVAKLETDLAKAISDLTVLNGKLEKATADAALAKTDFEGQLKAKDDAHAQAIEKLNTDHKAAIETKEADVEKRANLKAQQIAGGRGLSNPAKDEAKEQGAGAGKTMFEQYAEIKDPKARGEFYAANKEEILAGR